MGQGCRKNILLRYARDDDVEERMARIADGAEYRGLGIQEQHHDHSRKAYAKVERRVRERVLRGLHPNEK